MLLARREKFARRALRNIDSGSASVRLDVEGPGAESEEKREPVSDIDTGVVDSLKVLDPDGRLEKRTSSATTRMSALCQNRTNAPQQNSIVIQ